MVFSIKSIAAESSGEGFLAISGAVEWEYYEEQRPPNNLFLIPITLSGISSNYEIVSHLQIIPEIFHLVDYYNNDTSDLAIGEVLPFSYANYELQYQVGKWRFVGLNMGIKFGHYGYMSMDWSTPVYTLFLAPTISAYIELDNRFMIYIPVEVPVGLYLNNINEYFTVITGAELIFDPAGQISNPVIKNTLFSIGVSYSYLKIVTSDSIERELNFLKPYVKFSYLY